MAIALGIASAFLPDRHPFAVHSRWPLPVGLTTLLLLLVALAPWTLRNWLLLDELVPTTTNNGITLYDGWHVDNTTGGSDQSFVARMPQLGLMNETERDTYLKGKAMEAVREHPLRSAALAVRKAGRTWSPVPLSQADRPAYLLAGLVYSVPLFVLAAVGLLLSGLPRPGKWLLLTPAVYLTLIHMLSVGSVRYRLPAEPALAVLAAGGIWAIGVGYREWRQLRDRTDDETENDSAAGRGFEVIRPDQAVE